MFNIQEELKKLPDNPGVYIMKDESGTIIYVGKAVNLKNRVRQYFQSSSGHTAKVKVMVTRIHEFEYIVTDSELEALILECNLIKKHKPRYNILLKDDKNYPYIKVTMNEEYPRVLMTRRVDKDGARYFGPYSNVYAVRETIELIKKLFPIKTCQKVLPRDVGKNRPCLNYYIYQCLGPCQGDVNQEEYRGLMKDICSFLGGRQEDIVQRLDQQMKRAAENMDFERAAGLRDKLASLRHISEKQKVLSTAMEDQDVIAFAKDGEDSCIQVFFIRGGKLIGREHFILEGTAEEADKDLMSSFLMQFYTAAAFVPGEILLQEDIDELEIIEKWLGGRRDGRVHIRVPRRGEKHQLVEMVGQNAVMALKQFKLRLQEQGTLAEDGLKGLTDLLQLENLPQRIEAYDISNTGTSEMVGSLVVFEEGKPNTGEYRRFKIKTQSGQNDYGSMQEVLFRRFRHAEREVQEIREAGEEETGRGKFTVLPDLILLDGGLGHVHAAEEVLKELGINLPAFGMVKDDRHRTRGLVARDGREMDLSGNLPILRFVTAIQDEAHGFALAYNKALRKKRLSTSILDEIPGVGPQRRKALIKHFGSAARVRRATLEELVEVKGMSRSLAESIVLYFDKQ